MPPDYVKLRFVRQHGSYRQGDVIDYPRGPAKSLIAAGSCEYFVEPQRRLVEEAVAERRNVETADAPRRRGRRPMR